MFCPFKHVIWFFWCSSLIPHLFSCNAFIWWRFLIGSLWVYSRSCLEHFRFPRVLKCLTCHQIPHTTPVLSSLQPYLSISACRAHFLDFIIPMDSIREQFLKATEERKKAPWHFRLWTRSVWRSFPTTRDPWVSERSKEGWADPSVEFLADRSTLSLEYLKHKARSSFASPILDICTLTYGGYRQTSWRFFWFHSLFL